MAKSAQERSAEAAQKRLAFAEKELRHKVSDAASKPHDRPHGWLRDAEKPGDMGGVDLSPLAAVIVIQLLLIAPVAALERFALVML